MGIILYGPADLCQHIDKEKEPWRLNLSFNNNRKAIRSKGQYEINKFTNYRLKFRFLPEYAVQ